MTEEEQIEAAIQQALDSGAIDGALALGFGVAGLVFICLFVVLPWIFLHYLTKARSNSGLNQDEERMLEEIWKSSRTMERRIETLERLIDAEPKKSAQDMRQEAGDRIQ